MSTINGNIANPSPKTALRPRWIAEGHAWGWSRVAPGTNYPDKVIPICKWDPRERFLGGHITVEFLQSLKCSSCLVKVDEFLLEGSLSLAGPHVVGAALWAPKSP